ncbi:glycosyltransferase family 8 protein [Guptibacillus hwajinpoensis]|uniref:glycosyltransferase family 8 protein n=1 Tax=Guptibacillus hwajinpoensis TaxID=208199 RepID=UPI003D061022
MGLNVVYSADENYVRHAGASINSLLTNNKSFDEIQIYIIENEISTSSKEKLISLVNDFNRNITFLSMKQLCEKLKKKDDFPLSGYARLFLSQLNHIDKILYIDCDTIINQSLEELWSIDLSSYWVAGVQDNPAKYMVEIIGMGDRDRYLNSGVLLMNLKKWREIDIESKFLNFIDNYNGSVPHHDQGVINGVCKDNILVLEPRFNMMPQFLMHSSNQIKKLYDIKHFYTQEQLIKARKTPVIIHYISKFYNRPWFENCTHPYRGIYQNFVDKSPFEKVIYKSKTDIKLQARKAVYNHLPFICFYFLERFLDIKRKMNINKNFKNARNDSLG